MKILDFKIQNLKYIIFISILSTIFLVIYRQSDKKGLGRFWISFKMSVFLAGILSGLIPISAEGTETYGSNSSSSIQIEKVISNQECNSVNIGYNCDSEELELLQYDREKVTLIKDVTNSGELGKFGPGSKARGRARSSGSSGIPGANGFSPPPPIRYRTIPKVEDPMRAQNDAGVGNANDKKSPPSQPDHQCGAKVEIVYRIKENPALVREAEQSGRDQAAQRSMNDLIEQLAMGNKNPGIGSKSLKGPEYSIEKLRKVQKYWVKPIKKMNRK